jgi:hypothetical protein
LKVEATTRNWKTANKLLRMADEIKKALTKLSLEPLTI